MQGTKKQPQAVDVAANINGMAFARAQKSRLNPYYSRDAINGT
jgi:hypothetical protein